MFQKNVVRIAVTYENGEIFQHFGQTQEFKLYDTVDGEIIESKVVGTGGFTHCSLGSYLYETGVSVLICGNLGGGASKSLQAAGILVYGGNSGNADEAVAKLLRKELIYNPMPTCSDDHHHEEARSRRSILTELFGSEVEGRRPHDGSHKTAEREKKRRKRNLNHLKAATREHRH